MKAQVSAAAHGAQPVDVRAGRAPAAPRAQPAAIARGKPTTASPPGAPRREAAAAPDSTFARG